MPAKRKPIAQHRAQGTYRADRHEGWSEPEDMSTLPPAPPESLTEGARKEWMRITTLLGPSGRLTALDSVVLTQYCELAAQLADSPKDFNAPMHTALRLLASELGLTPTSRSKIAEPTKPHAENPFTQFL